MRRALRLDAPILLVALLVALFTSVASAHGAARTFSVSHPAAFPGNDRDSDEAIRQGRAAVIRTAKSLGATHVRIWATWPALHTCNPNRARNMALVQTSIRQVRDAGMVPMISLTGIASPDWGLPCANHLPTGVNPSPKAYANYVSYVAMHTMREPYGVRIYQTYNEPDYPGFLCVMPTSVKLKNGTRAALELRKVVKPRKKQPAAGEPVNQRHKWVGYYPMGNGRFIRKECNARSLAAGRLRKLHSSAVGALKVNAAAIGLPRTSLTILFGDFSPKGLGFMSWVLRDMRKLDADGISVHSYWEASKTDPVTMPTRCTSRSRDYFGMECLDRVRGLLQRRGRRVPRVRNLPIWITEGGLWVGHQQAGDNMRRAMEHMRTADGVVMVNWYHITQSPGWETWITDANGAPSHGGERLHRWARARMAAPAAWLAPSPGGVSCADGTYPDVSVRCPMAPPAPVTPAAAPDSWLIHKTVTDY